MQAVQKVQSLNLCPGRSQGKRQRPNESTTLAPSDVRRQRQADQPGLQSALGQTVPHLPTQHMCPQLAKSSFLMPLLDC